VSVKKFSYWLAWVASIGGPHRAQLFGARWGIIGDRTRANDPRVR
jgi:hypothetical protein